MLKKFKVYLVSMSVLLFCVSCSHSIRNQKSHIDSIPVQWSQMKLGVVLGPGGARTQSQIGFLRELERNQIPIHAVVGLEWGSYVGALFSQKGKSNDIEWQISKLDSIFFSKKLLSSGMKRVEDLSDFLSTSFGKLRIEESKIHFSCPTMNMNTQQNRFLNSGYATEVVRLCLPLPPLLHPAGGQVAGAMDISGALEYLSLHGANYYIYVDVISAQKPTLNEDLNPEARWVWSFLLKEIQNSKSKFHSYIEIPVAFNVSDLKSRKRAIEQGELAGKDFVVKLKKTLHENK